MTVPEGTPKNKEWADRMRQALQIAGSNVGVLKERFGHAHLIRGKVFTDIADALRRLDVIADELQAFSMPQHGCSEPDHDHYRPRLWCVVHRSHVSEDRYHDDRCIASTHSGDCRFTRFSREGHIEGCEIGDGCRCICHLPYGHPGRGEPVLAGPDWLEVTFGFKNWERPVDSPWMGICRNCGHEAHGFDVQEFSVVCGHDDECQCRGM